MKDLIPLYQEMAASGQSFRGLSILQHRKEIGALLKAHRCASLIDWGCGAGDAYRSPHKVQQDFGIRTGNIALYDPAFPSRAKLPAGRADAVVCSDVLEHVPEADVPAFVENLFARATKVVWASVCTRPAKKTFPGTDVNLHITLHPLTWWAAQFAEAGARHPGVVFQLVETP